jgi:DNA (cytosine-5)-methyltransferase 1
LVIPVVDLFAGPGGLGEGFSAFSAGSGRRFKLALSIEKDPAAFSTLQLRAFFRQFPRGNAPEEYYATLRGDLPVGALYDRFPVEKRAAERETWNIELGSPALPQEELDARIRAVVQHSDEWVLIGGPPCQAYSTAGRSRNRAVEGYKAEADGRHFLYREYLRIIVRHWPSVFVLENVKGILSSRVQDQQIFGRILEDLQDPVKATGTTRRAADPFTGYRLFSLSKPSAGFDIFGLPEHRADDYIVESEWYGIPQARHRVILLGVRNDITLEPAVLTRRKTLLPATCVLNGLPRLRSGLSAQSDGRSQWTSALKGILKRPLLTAIRNQAGDAVARRIMRTIRGLKVPRADRGAEFVEFESTCQYAPQWYLDNRLGGVCNNTTRAHIVEDLWRYMYASSFAAEYGRSPRLRDFPEELLPDHANIRESMGHGNFSDRFRVQLGNVPATTIVSHIAKDGHYFIHPDPSQCRSLTVREAARLQTFPDNYFFCGNRTEQYSQVGNAVPPLLAVQIAATVDQLLAATLVRTHGRLAYA